VDNVKSAWLSKINWTQAVTFLAMILTLVGVDMPADVKVAVEVGIASIGQVATWVIRTWFTKSLTAASVK
jgi:hypothetical protein